MEGVLPVDINVSAVFGVLFSPIIPILDSANIHLSRFYEDNGGER